YLSVDQVSFKETQSDDNNSERYLRLAINFPVLSKGTPESVGVSSVKLNQIDQLINQEIKQGFPGAVLLVAKNGKMIKHTAYGYAKRYNEDGKQLESPIIMKKDTMFDLASNTKMYATTFAVMKLVSEGKLDVNQPIRQYLPEYTGNGRDTRLVKDLLQHTAGYRPIFRFYDKNNALGERYYSQHRERTQNILLTQIPFDKGRNIESKYSDLDFMLLGILIERITRQPLDEYVNEHFYQPLNLNQTRFNPLQANIPKNQIAATELRGNSRDNHVEFINNRTQVIHGEVHDENAFYAMQGVSGHAGLFSTAEEVATLASMMLNQGGYGDFEFFNRNVIQSFVSPSPLDNTIGLGWRLAGFQQRTHHFGLYASPYAFGHTGWTGTVTVIDPYYDLVIVLLTNKKHTPIMEDNGNLQFKGDTFETGKYGKIISMVYQSFLNQPNSNQVKTDAK
ncbi:MAG: penicillin binding protein PBP4B, partial [Gammaproteobacteria bacterium]|nr:penicillin binding protein PBP4B [Gammaproteobacteria bacterium]